jgi:hypothetical protein
MPMRCEVRDARGDQTPPRQVNDYRRAAIAAGAGTCISARKIPSMPTRDPRRCLTLGISTYTTRNQPQRAKPITSR